MKDHGANVAFHQKHGTSLPPFMLLALKVANAKTCFYIISATLYAMCYIIFAIIIYATLYVALH